MVARASLTPSMEIQLSQQARAALAAARALLATLAPAQEVLERGEAGGTETERLQAALRVCAGENPGRLDDIRRLLAEAERGHWELALSAAFLIRSTIRRLKTLELDPEELEQHGYLGLLEAARRFDPARGLRFSTYASWWVRAHLQRALETSGRLVRLPGRVRIDLRRLHVAARELQARNLPSSPERLARAAGISSPRAPAVEPGGARLAGGSQRGRAAAEGAARG